MAANSVPSSSIFSPPGADHTAQGRGANLRVAPIQPTGADQVAPMSGADHMVAPAYGADRTVAPA